MNYTTADYLESLINDLATLKTNLAAKGVEVTEDDDFTSLAAKVPMITSGAFKVASIVERDAIQYKREGDVCLVMRDEAYNVIPATSTIQAGVQIQFKPTVVLENELQGWSALNYNQSGGSSWQGFNMLYFVTGQEKYITVTTPAGTYRYDTQDGLTFELQSPIPTVTPNDPISTSNTLGDLTKFFDVVQYQEAEYLGIYTYDGSAWVGYDFGNTATANDIIENLTGVFNNGLQTGTFPRMNVKQDVIRVIDYANRPIVLPADATSYLRDLPINVTDISYFKFNAAATTNINSLFYGNNQITELDLSDWGWSATISNIQNAFMNMPNLEYLDISGLKLSAYLGARNETKNFSSTIKTFIWKNGIIGPSQYMNGSWFDQLLDVEYIDLSGSTMSAGYGRYQNMFNYLNTKLKTLIMKNMRFNNMNTGNVAGWGGFQIPNIETIDLSGCTFSNNSAAYLFEAFKNDTKLTNLNLNFGTTITPKYVSSAFENCSSLTEIDLTKVSFSNSDLKFAGYMFKGCTALTNIININQVWRPQSNGVYNMFYQCQSLTTLDLTNFNMTDVTQLVCVFYDCKSLINLDLSTWAPNNLTDLSQTFNQCTSLQQLDIRNLDFSNITTHAYTFGNPNSATSQVPANCLIIVKDQTAKDWINTNYTWLTNVQTVTEYEASLQGGNE